MEICIAGWYFEPQLFAELTRVKNRFPVTIITDHRRVAENADRFQCVKDSGINIVNIPLAGLEWAKYDHYIKNIWSLDNVLFMHDDIRIKDPLFFDKIADSQVDQAFIFQTEEKGKQNQNFHGRGIFCSARFIDLMLRYRCECAQAIDQPDRHHNPGAILTGCGPHKGFWFDPWNDGHASGKPPVGVRHYNDGVYHFALFCKRLASGTMPGCSEKMNSDQKLYFPEFEHGKRGIF